MNHRLPTWFRTIAILLALAAGSFTSLAFEPPEQTTALHAKQFFERELYISSTHEKIETAALRQRSGAARVDAFFETHGTEFKFFLDPRSNSLSNMIGRVPLIPGSGVGNDRTLEQISAELGRSLVAVDEWVVRDVALSFIESNAELIGIDPAQVGTSRTTKVTESLWQLSIPQQLNGIPVRHGRIVATIKHGNLVLLGTESWGNASVDTQPAISAQEALALGFAYADGLTPADEIWQQPTLEIVPFAPQQYQSGDTFVGPAGSGYEHRLVWAFGFTRQPEIERWEILVDAHSGEVISFEDTNHYFADDEIVGGVYPLTSTEICPSNETCGAMQQDQPMPFADTGLPAPNDFTNAHGLYDSAAGQAATELSGPYIHIKDRCGDVNESTTEGRLDLGGVNGDHDCDSAGSAGNTSSARSCFYELNKMAEMGRGWLPNNTWLTQQLTADLNINNNCNATWSGGEVNFYTSGGGCRNTGEIAAIFDHEWGHGLDDNDANGFISNSGEAYADIAAIYRLHASCVGYGFRHTSDQGCGETSDGTGMNSNESQLGTHCAVDCSGARDTDWGKHEDQTPDTPQNFVCNECFSGGGPCGKQNHCSAAPTRQAAWDFAARDLRGLPFNYDHNTAFIVANKIFYEGSGNVGNWHACSCPNSSDGCGASNGYMQWLAADDDNGNLADGTPHMAALQSAFARHNIACDEPAPQTGGCAGKPTAAPVLTVTPTTGSLDLAWQAVPNAVEYRVFRTEGYAGCEFGKVLLDTVGGTSYADSGLAEGREYSYVVQAVGSTGECYSAASQCVTATSGGPVLALQGTTVTDSCLGVGAGGGNGVADPGEDIVLTARLRNVGPTPSTGITAVLTSTTPGATVTQGATTYPDLAAGESAPGDGALLSFTVDDGLPCGTSLFFDLNAQANEGSWTNVVHVRLASDFAGQCDECTVASPGPVTGLEWPTTEENLEWSPASTTSFYRLYRGVPADLPNLLDFADDSCLRLTTVDTGTGELLDEIPPSSSFYWYLVTSGNGSGEGSAGDATSGPRVRNGDGSCP